MEVRVSNLVHNILNASCDEAMRTGYMATSADHIMLALLHHKDNSACKALCAMGIDLAELKDFIDSRIVRPQTISYSELPNIKPSKQAMATIKNAIYEAYKEGVEMGSLHLLLAICRTNGSASADFLQEHGLDYDFILAYYTRKKLNSKTRSARLDSYTPQIMNALGEQLTKIFSSANDSFAS